MVNYSETAKECLGYLFVVMHSNRCEIIVSGLLNTTYEESVVDKFKSNLLLMIFWLHIINYNS
jgi:hypothetical protein